MQVDFVELFKELASDVNLDPFTKKYCASRIRSEGISFLTVTLPKLAKSILRSLELGYFDRTDLTCFAWKGCSLRYFRSLLSGIFDIDGKVLLDVDPLSIWRVRQLSEYCYKLSLEFTDAQVAKAEQSFILTENELDSSDHDAKFVNQLRKDFETYYKDISSSTLDTVIAGNVLRYTSGSFSTAKSLPSKNTFPYYMVKHSIDVDIAYPSRYNAISGVFKEYPSAPKNRLVQKDDTSDYSEVLFVPKDSRGPRVITREPLKRLAVQMVFFDFMSTSLEKISHNRINFQDQQINRNLALQSSITRENATLDLKEASDRVDRKIVDIIFSNSPACRYFIRQRSRSTVLPSGNTLRLRKLAGMGSGLTFPVMALLIHLAITRQIVTDSGITYDRARRLVYVYGDDIVVPTKYFNSACNALEKVKLKVNVAKSFHKSLFRESCGGDYFKGNDVSPVRLKLANAKLIINKTRVNILNGILPIERHTRELIKNGLVSLFRFWVNKLKAIIPLPKGTGVTPCLVEYSVLPVTYKQDKVGNFEEIKCITPLPDCKEAYVDQNPYRFLAGKISVTDFNPLSYLWESAVGSAYNEVNVPRSQKLAFGKVNSFRLMG